MPGCLVVIRNLRNVQGFFHLMMIITTDIYVYLSPTKYLYTLAKLIIIVSVT